MLAVLAALIMTLMIILFYHKQQSGKLYIAVIHYTGDEAGDDVTLIQYNGEYHG